MRSDQRVNLQPAYVLHQRAYRDSSAILELFTPEYGRVAVIARGIKRPKSRMRGVVQSFQPLLVSWSGRGEMGTLATAEAQGGAIQLPPDIVACGLYLNELMIKLTHRHDPHIELFSSYDSALRCLSAARGEGAQWSVQSCLRLFEVSLLQSLGYALMLEKDSETHAPVQPDKDYIYSIEEGPALRSAETDDEFGIRISGATLLALAHKSLSGGHHGASQFREAKILMREVLDYYLGHKPLHSRQLIAGGQMMNPANKSQ